MRRRELILGAAGLAAVGSKALAADDLTAVARDAYIFTLPLIETAAQRAGTPPNRIVHRRTLADFKSRNVTTPNNDTLYSVAQLDLSGGPVTLTLPDSGKRYLSVALMDAYTNNFAIPGTRTTGGRAVTLTVVGPKDGRAGANILRSPTNHVWLLARTLVDSVADLPAATAVQSGITVSGPSLAPAPAFARRQAAWADYFAAADKLLVADPPPAADAAMMARIAALGLGKGAFDAARFTPEQAAQIAAGVADARRPARAQMPSSTPSTAGTSGGVLGDFGTNYALRAQTAISGLAALPAVEAMYTRPAPPPGGFDGGKLARMHFDAGALPPVTAFWSLTMYEQTPENQLFFVENSLGRYAIGDRTPGLVRNPDGSLDIWLSATDPGPNRRANWLPAPKGAYVITLRAYLPKPEMLSGRWKAPPVVLA